MSHFRKHLLVAPLALILTAGVASAQHGGGGHGGGGHGGGGHGGGGWYGGGGHAGGAYHGGYAGGYHGGYAAPYHGGYGASHALRSFYGGGALIGGYPYHGYAYGGFGYPVGGIGYGSPYLGYGYGYGYGGIGGSSYYAPPVGYAARSPDLFNPSPGAAPLTAPPDSPSLSAVSRPANVTVLVPDGAEVAFEGNVNSETGKTRRYTSPALEPGYDYALNVKVTPPSGTTRPYRVIVRAGDDKTFDLTK